jgi:hypothetical protein
MRPGGNAIAWPRYPRCSALPRFGGYHHHHIIIIIILMIVVVGEGSRRETIIIKH